MEPVILTPELLFKLKNFVKAPKVLFNKDEYDTNHVRFEKNYVALLYIDGYAAHVDVEGYKIFLDDIGTSDMPDFVEFSGDLARTEAEFLLFSLALKNGDI